MFTEECLKWFIQQAQTQVITRATIYPGNQISILIYSLIPMRSGDDYNFCKLHYRTQDTGFTKGADPDYTWDYCPNRISLEQKLTKELSPIPWAWIKQEVSKTYSKMEFGDLYIPISNASFPIILHHARAFGALEVKYQLGLHANSHQRISSTFLHRYGKFIDTIQQENPLMVI